MLFSRSARLAVALALLLSRAVAAQNIGATLQGLITDEQHAVLPGVSVTKPFKYDTIVFDANGPEPVLPQQYDPTNTHVAAVAGRSAVAAREIKGLIRDSMHRVEEGSSLVTESGQTRAAALLQ